MSTDRELMELAAKAAGLRLFVWGKKDAENYCLKLADGTAGARWNPKDDDGDAFRLAVALRLVLLLELPRIGIGPMLDGPEFYVEDGDDEMAAARLAVFLAAVAIGRAMP